MVSVVELSVEWSASVLGVAARTSPPRDSQDEAEFCLVERTGGLLDWPHDSPEVTFQLWARADERAEQLAMMLAIAAKTVPPRDRHINAVGVPSVSSYGEVDGGFFVWQVSLPLEMNLLD